MVKALLCPSCGGALDPDARACPQCGVVAATRRCGVCLDLSLADDTNCRRCGALLPVERLDARDRRLDCPHCGRPMIPRQVASAVFDECDSCGGLWLSPVAATLVTTKAETRAQLRPFDNVAPHGQAPLPAAAAAYRPCPVCRRLMNRTQHAIGSGVVLDLCKQHGIFYDRGELTRLLAFIEGGGLEKARRREKEALQDRIRDLQRQAIRAGAASDTAVPGLVEPTGGAGAIDLLGWIAGYLLGNRSENSG